MNCIHLRIDQQMLHALTDKRPDEPHMIRVIVRCQNVVYILDFQRVFLQRFVKRRQRPRIVGIDQQAVEEIGICVSVFQFDHARL